MQAFADALKLILKEYVAPTQANFLLFFLGPIVTLIFSLLGYAVIPYGPGLSLSDMELGILFMLAVSSLATYGILLAGFYFTKSPSIVQTIDYNPIEFQEKFLMSELEAKQALFIKHERSTTSRLFLYIGIGVLYYIFVSLFLNINTIWYSKGWLSFNLFNFVLTFFVLFCSLTIVYFIFKDFYLLYIYKSSNDINRFKLSDVKDISK